MTRAASRPDGVVVIAVDNEYRRDDGAGAAVAGIVRDRLDRSIPVLVLDGEPSRLVDAWEGADAAVVVDATRSGVAPGTVEVFEVGVDSLPPPRSSGSSHALGLAHAVELGRALDRLPGRLVLVGIEGGDFGEGIGLSPPVEQAIPRAAEVVAAQVDELRHDVHGPSEEVV